MPQQLEVHPRREYHKHQIQVFFGSILHWRKRSKTAFHHAYKDPLGLQLWAMEGRKTGNGEIELIWPERVAWIFVQYVRHHGPWLGG